MTKVEFWHGVAIALLIFACTALSLALTLLVFGKMIAPLYTLAAIGFFGTVPAIFRKEYLIEKAEKAKDNRFKLV